jgi:signal transduction histidine kinase/CheY-like chemotaxis protein
MPASRSERLLAFARDLQTAYSFPELLEASLGAVRDALGYAHVWLLVAERDDFEELRLIDVAGMRDALAWNRAPIVRVRGDALLEALSRATEPVVVADARTDPRTDKELVSRCGHRTIVQVPFRVLGRPIGVLGVGTFGDEGCRVPETGDLEYLVGMASQLGVAAARIRSDESVRQIQKLEALGQLAGGLAHDFNNILAALSVAAEFLVPAPDEAPPEAREALDDLRGAVERGVALTRQLLAFSRRSVIQPRALDLNEQIGHLVKTLRRLVPEDVILNLVLCPGALVVQADPALMDQVLLNLVVNARDAMPRGGTLTVETLPREIGEAEARAAGRGKPGRHACLRVTDSGVGMTTEVLRHVFEPFFTTKAPGKGTGLGLATVASIVDQHGGAVVVQSEVGHGTTFEVRLPLVAAPADRPARPAARSVQGAGETILLVEDDPFVRQPIRRLLERNGYRVLEAASGREALDAWEARRGDVQLLLTDVVMPGGMSGRELASRLVQRGAGLKIIYTSGYAADAAASQLAASDLFLPKPCPPEALLEAIRRSLES